MHPVTLLGERITLREWTDEDAASVPEYAFDDEVRRYLIRSVEDLLAEPRRGITEAQRPQRTEYWLAVEKAATREIIGSIVLRIDDPAHRRGLLGLVLRTRDWGQGYAGEALHLMIPFAFDTLGLHRLWAVTDPQHERAQRVLKSSGLRLEGLLRHYYLYPDGWHDALIFGMIASDRSPEYTQG